MFGMASVILIIPTWSALKNHVWRMTRHDFCSYIIVFSTHDERRKFLGVVWSRPYTSFWLYIRGPHLHLCTQFEFFNFTFVLLSTIGESSFCDLLLHHLAARHYLHNSGDNLDFGFILFYSGLVIDFEG